MRIDCVYLASIVVLFLTLPWATPVEALCQVGSGSIVASPVPITTEDEVTLTAFGLCSCTQEGPVTVVGRTVTVDFEEQACGVPPAPSPLEQQATIGPLDAGIYELKLNDEGELLASGSFEVFDSAKCVSSLTTLCLDDRRFQVEVDFRASDGTSGQASVIEVTDDSGLFTFFSSTNVELIVKVLDQCNSAFNSFWVFSAGVTNVEVDIRVTDTKTDESRTYTNPLGRVFESVLDTRAFETCL